MFNRRFLDFLKNVVITGNIILILWVLYNGINEGFDGTRAEIFSYIVFIILLAVNSFLLIKGRHKN